MANQKPLPPVALEEAFQSASQVIRERKLTPESEGAESLEKNLTLMLRNGDARIYDLISHLPPGYYSESIVHNAFMRAQFTDLKNVFDACAPIKEKDLHRAAINGAAGTLKMRARSSGAVVNVTRSDIEQLRASGLHPQALSSMIVQGVVAGNLGTADIVAEIDDQSNLMLSAALHELPAAKAKEVFTEALKQEKPVGPEAVAWFSGFPPETAARGTRSVVKEWMTAGPPKDAAMAVIVSDCLMNGNQETASEWAAQISDDSLREKNQTQVRNWKKQ